MRRIQRFVQELARVPASKDLTNPFAQEDPALDRPGAAAIRRENLRRYLSFFLKRRPRLMIVGEAPGYRGCRFSGVVFTSEYTLLNHPFFKGGGFERSSCREQPWREASASIVWEAIDQLQTAPLLWTASRFTRTARESP